MSSTLFVKPELLSGSLENSPQYAINEMIDEFIASLPDPTNLTSVERRGIIARYTSVLEGNFIYWMTATYMATHSDAARSIILDNLHEEIRDAHPAMLRRFAIAAHGYPDSLDAFAVHEDLTKVRLFLGRLFGAPSILMMAFFEGLIQRFMPCLATLAAMEGSSEMEYTDVHGVCDVEHTAGLFRAFDEELSVKPVASNTDVFEGVNLLCTLLRTIVFGRIYSIAI